LEHPGAAARRTIRRQGLCSPSRCSRTTPSHVLERLPLIGEQTEPFGASPHGPALLRLFDEEHRGRTWQPPAPHPSVTDSMKRRPTRPRPNPRTPYQRRHKMRVPPQALVATWATPRRRRLHAREGGSVSGRRAEADTDTTVPDDPSPAPEAVSPPSTEEPANDNEPIEQPTATGTE